MATILLYNLERIYPDQEKVAKVKTINKRKNRLLIVEETQRGFVRKKKVYLLFLELNPEQQNQFLVPATWPRNSVRVSNNFGIAQNLTNLGDKKYFLSWTSGLNRVSSP